VNLLIYIKNKLYSSEQFRQIILCFVCIYLYIFINSRDDAIFICSSFFSFLDFNIFIVCVHAWVVSLLTGLFWGGRRAYVFSCVREYVRARMRTRQRATDSKNEAMTWHCVFYFLRSESIYYYYYYYCIFIYFLFLLLSILLKS
jgi:hypothetical protein